jgi:Protein of unknown function (DUF559)
VARRQLLALGISARETERRIADGRLIRLHRGVYAVGHRILTPHGHSMAAVLALGPRAVLSHKSAGSLHELLTTAQTRTDITVPKANRARPRKGLRIHVTDTLHPDDIDEVDGIPVTSIARTILDLAAVLASTQLRRVLEQADRNGVLNLLALERALDRRPRARGRSSLRAILRDYTGAPPTRSVFERAFLELVEKAGLPKPLVNASLAGLEPDVYWPQWGLVVELDSRGFHSDPRTFESDRIRDARLQRLGLRVLRVTWKRLKHEPDAVLDDVLALARLGGSSSLDLALARH